MQIVVLDHPRVQVTVVEFDINLQYVLSEAPKHQLIIVLRYLLKDSKRYLTQIVLEQLPSENQFQTIDNSHLNKVLDAEARGNADHPPFKLLITNTELPMSSVILVDEFEEQDKLIGPDDPDIHKLKEEAMDDKLTVVDGYHTNTPGKHLNYSLNHMVVKK